MRGASHVRRANLFSSRPNNHSTPVTRNETPDLSVPVRFSMRAAVHWALILVLVIDLVGSPFHAHRHDHYADAASPHAPHADDAAKAAAAMHFDAHEDRRSGHMSLAVLPSGAQLGPWHPIVQAIVYTLEPADRAPPLALAEVAWSAVPERIPLLRDLHLRPDGRAPPLLR